MEIYPEMVQDGIIAIVRKYQDRSVLTSVSEMARLTDEQLKECLDREWVALTRELTEHAYSFAELPPPRWRTV